jgi:hypothetical protein
MKKAIKKKQEPNNVIITIKYAAKILLVREPNSITIQNRGIKTNSNPIKNNIKSCATNVITSPKNMEINEYNQTFCLINIFFIL